MSSAIRLFLRIDKNDSTDPAELTNGYENPYTPVIIDDWLRNPGRPVLHVLLNESTSEIELFQVFSRYFFQRTKFKFIFVE